MTTEFNGPLIVVPGSHREGLVRKDPNRKEIDETS